MWESLGAAILKVTPSWAEVRTFMDEKGAGWLVATAMYIDRVKLKRAEMKSEKMKDTALENISKLVTDESDEVKLVLKGQETMFKNQEEMLNDLKEISRDIQHGVMQRDGLLEKIFDAVFKKGL